jgi:hypothetical protein
MLCLAPLEELFIVEPKRRNALAAAETTTILEVKEAYLNLEQGWLQLAPEIEGGRISSISREPDKSGRESGQWIRRNAPRT